jgi:hypothetical protein
MAATGGETPLIVQEQTVWIHWWAFGHEHVIADLIDLIP